MTKQRSPAMQFYFRQFAADDAVTSMDLDAVGAHILLMCAAGSASSGYEIPADDRAIRTRLRNPSDADYERIKGQLLAGAWKVSPDGQRWIQYGMRRTLLKQKEFSKLQSERAKGSRNEAGMKPESSRAGIAGSQPTSTSSSSSESTNNIYKAGGLGKVNYPTPDSPVLLTENEIEKLTDTLGQECFDYLTGQLANFSTTNPKKFREYESHYQKLLDWDRMRVQDGREFSIHEKHGPGYYKTRDSI